MQDINLRTGLIVSTTNHTPWRCALEKEGLILYHISHLRIVYNRVAHDRKLGISQLKKRYNKRERKYDHINRIEAQSHFTLFALH